MYFMPHLESIDISATHGILEGLLRTDDEQAGPRYAAVVCHPHPLGGGTMHNKVVVAITRALNMSGIPVLRFNFRGVGRSTGSYDDGRGETEDVRTALDWMAARYPDHPLLLAGFSFGSWVGLPVGETDPRVTRMIGVGVPVRMLDMSALMTSRKPKLIVQGSNDEYGSQADIEAWFAALPEPKSLRIIPGATHFFHEQLDQLEGAIVEWIG
jgi:uncharacterized protein